MRRRIAAVLDACTDLVVVGSEGEPVAARRSVRRARPDLVVAGLQLPGVDGIQLAHLLLADDPHLRVLIVSDVAHTLFAQRALDAGASGYLLASAGDDELARAVRKVLDGGIHVPAEFIDRVWPRDRGECDLTRVEADVVAAYRAGATTPAAVARALEMPESRVRRVEMSLIRRLGTYSRAGVRLYAHRSKASANASDMDNASV